MSVTPAVWCDADPVESDETEKTLSALLSFYQIKSSNDVRYPMRAFVPNPLQYCRCQGYSHVVGGRFLDVRSVQEDMRQRNV